MTTPALQRLREAAPDASITILTHQKLAPLYSDQPFVNDIISFTPTDTPLTIARKLRAEHFDVSLALPNSHRSALELWLARIPVRVGLATLGRSWLFTTAVHSHPAAVRMRKPRPKEARRRFSLQLPPAPSPPLQAHQLHHYLHLMSALGANPVPLHPRLEVSDLNLRETQCKFGIPDEPLLLGLNPGAEYGPAKRWPVEHFIATAQQLQQSTKCRWAIFGGPNDRELAQHIEMQLRETLHDHQPDRLPLNLAGRTTLRELCAALRCCRALLTNDTGPMHVAAAVGTPVVTPFGSTSPELTGPGLPGDPRHRVLRHPTPCAPCFLRECPMHLECLNGIKPAQVAAAVREVAKP